MLILILCHSTTRSSKIDENYEVNVCVRVYADRSFDAVNPTVPIVRYAVSSLSYNFFLMKFTPKVTIIRCGH